MRILYILQQHRAPGGKVVRAQATETSLQLLVDVFRLSISLRVVAGDKADRGTNEIAESSPEPSHKLGPLVNELTLFLQCGAQGQSLLSPSQARTYYQSRNTLKGEVQINRRR